MDGVIVAEFSARDVEPVMVTLDVCVSGEATECATEDVSVAVKDWAELRIRVLEPEQVFDWLYDID